MTGFLQKVKEDQKGVTLVELMVVVVIIGILVAIAVPVYSGAQARAREGANNANIQIIEGAALVYASEGQDISDLSGEINEDHPLITGEYLKETPKPPTGYTAYILDEEGKVEKNKEE